MRSSMACEKVVLPDPSGPSRQRKRPPLKSRPPRRESLRRRVRMPERTASSATRTRPVRRDNVLRTLPAIRSSSVQRASVPMAISSSQSESPSKDAEHARKPSASSRRHSCNRARWSSRGLMMPWRVSPLSMLIAASHPGRATRMPACSRLDCSTTSASAYSIPQTLCSLQRSSGRTPPGCSWWKTLRRRKPAWEVRPTTSQPVSPQTRRTISSALWVAAASMARSTSLRVSSGSPAYPRSTQ